MAHRINSRMLATHNPVANSLDVPGLLLTNLAAELFLKK